MIRILMEVEMVLDMAVVDWGRSGAGPLTGVMGHGVRW